MKLLFIYVFNEKMNKVHVCDCCLDLAIYLYRTNPHEIPESELMLTLDLCQ